MYFKICFLVTSKCVVDEDLDSVLIKIRNGQFPLCVDTLGEKGSKIEQVGLYTCHGMGGNQVSGLYTLHMRPLFSSTSNKVPYGFPNQRPKKVYVGKWRTHVHEAVQGFPRGPAPVKIH